MAFGCVCSSHVSGWLTSVEVFAVVPLGVSGFLSCWGAGRFHRGIRIQAAAASCAHVSCSGGREPVAWVQIQWAGNRIFLVFSEEARAPVSRRQGPQHVSMSATFSWPATFCTSNFSISYRILQPQLLRAHVARLSDETTLQTSGWNSSA